MFLMNRTFNMLFVQLFSTKYLLHLFQRVVRSLAELDQILETQRNEHTSFRTSHEYPIIA